LQWQKFVNECPRFRRKRRDTIYALPGSLIDKIVRYIPGFFTDDEQTFERCLAEHAGIGFFDGQPIRFPWLLNDGPQVSGSNEEAELEQRQRQSDQQIIELLTDSLKHDGASDAEITRYFVASSKLQQEAFDQQRAYLGWLVTNPHFRIWLVELRNDWSDVNPDGLPRLPYDWPANGIDARDPNREAVGGLILKMSSWCISGFASWELPLPMEPGLLNPGIHPDWARSPAGVNVFVPWYMLRDQKIQLPNLVELARGSQQPQHLSEWLDGRPKGWKFKPFVRMFALYVYRELALGSRYRERLEGNIDRIDHAFGQYFAENESQIRKDPGETVRKDRQAMQKRLLGGLPRKR